MARRSAGPGRDEANRGTFQSYFSALRTGGYISEDAGFISITSDGPAAAGVESGTPPVTAAEIREQWRSVLKAGARNMLDHLLAVYPAGVKRAGATEVMIHPVSLHE